ncbi:1-aminocyclopropane-1-carboxylate deaminase/D-cysteine desulfhydrase [Aureitalea sp. L0-47]|nr:1-aminocyclopropane-1-carboxylate deaminase/D-cysteine desulfhydrase [Aureitalea sp. L0-47]
MGKKDIHFFLQKLTSENQKVGLDEIVDATISLHLKREDTIHKMISGNKFRKLKYTLIDFLSSNKKAILTFGGAHSNHIAAVASAGRMCGIKTIGLIRGEELITEISNNPTLRFASECGMQLKFMTRTDYREKTDPHILSKYVEDMGDMYLVPEGGTSELAIKGCEEILDELDASFDYVCVPVGTGGTFAGLLNALQPHQKGIGYSVLKGTFQKEIIEKYASNRNYLLTDDYCFGGYAKIDSELIRFMNNFNRNTGIALDPVYTGKMMYGIYEMIKAGYFRENSRILAIHTGGLQGVEAMNHRLKKKNLPQIDI